MEESYLHGKERNKNNETIVSWCKITETVAMDFLEDDTEVIEEFDVLYSITPKMDVEDLSTLEEDLLSDLDDEEEDIDF